MTKQYPVPDSGSRLRIRVASAVADILVHEGGIPKDTAQLVMDRLTDGLVDVPQYVLLGALNELLLVSDIREPDAAIGDGGSNEQ
jgi:hypothetical protein